MSTLKRLWRRLVGHSKDSDIVQAARRIVAENIRDLMFVLSFDGRVVDLNKTAQEALGGNGAQVVGRQANVLYGQWAELFNRYRGVESAREQVTVGDSSSQRFYDCSVSPIKDPKGHLLGRLVIMHDIDELRQAEVAIRKSEDEFRTVVETASDAIVTANHEGNIVLWGKGAEAIFGYPAAEVAGKELDLLIPERFRKEFRGKLQQVALGESEFAGRYVETRGQRNDGTEIDVEYSLATWKTGGKPFFTVIFRDVTVRKQMQKRLEDLYEEEKALRQQLQEEMEMKLSFTRTLVHEMKTPLTPVMASSELLADELPEGHLRDLAQNVLRGACQMNDRAEELFDLMRGEAGILEVRPVLLTPLPVLQEVASEIAPLIKSRGQLLVVELPSSLPTIYASKDRLRQVMLNLLNNAARYTPKGGTITVRAFAKDNNLVVEVQDDGVGIGDEDKLWLFKPYRHKTVSNEAGSGLGVGLALCKMIVELHHGQIWVDTEMGKGSTFSFSLPIASSTPQAEQNGRK